jgi:hypothetical protein
LLGILNPDSIEAKWLHPIGRNLVLSPEIIGITPPKTLDTFTDLMIDLSERLGDALPKRVEAGALPAGLAVPARIGFADVPWFGLGWEFAEPIDLKLPDMESLAFEGTWVKYDTTKVERNAVFVEYCFELASPKSVRVMFNTQENCKVFLNGKLVFARESGRMAPSPHRAPVNQAIDATLAAGKHLLVAVIKTPEPRKTVEWVVGVSDRNHNDQWLPSIWSHP